VAQLDGAPPLIPLQPADQPVEPKIEELVEVVIQNIQDMPAPDIVVDEHVLAMDEMTNSDSDAPAPQVQLPIPPVEIVPFPEFNNLQPLMPEEDQLEDLLGWVHPNDSNGPNDPDEQPQQFHQNIQLGLVQLHEPAIDPVWAQLSSQSPYPEALSLWVRHLSSSSSNSTSVLIPDQWMDFFSFMLLQSPTFDWASSFL
jgi:hypothetical protein